MRSPAFAVNVRKSVSHALEMVPQVLPAVLSVWPLSRRCGAGFALPRHDTTR